MEGLNSSVGFIGKCLLLYILMQKKLSTRLALVQKPETNC